MDGICVCTYNIGYTTPSVSALSEHDKAPVVLPSRDNSSPAYGVQPKDGPTPEGA